MQHARMKTLFVSIIYLRVCLLNRILSSFLFPEWNSATVGNDLMVLGKITEQGPFVQSIVSSTR